jgi:biopolymer transport protein ExbD
MNDLIDLIDLHDDDSTSCFLPLIDVLLVTLLYFIVSYQEIGSVDPFRFGTPKTEVKQSGPAPFTFELTREGQFRYRNVLIAQADLEAKLQQEKPETVVIWGDRKAPLERAHLAQKLCADANIRQVKWNYLHASSTEARVSQ